MIKRHDKDTRYFLEIDIKTMKIIKHDFDQKHNLNKGRQKNSETYRLFLTKGQYNKFVNQENQNT